jgi:hypothetical protein
MSIVQRGIEELARREREEVELDVRQVEENRRSVEWWFRFVFQYRGAPKAELEDWTPHGTESYSPSSFEYEGVRYYVEWNFEGAGGDRAYWDNGWWPKWYVIVRRPWRFFPFLRHDVKVPVWGEASVAKALR